MSERGDEINRRWGKRLLARTYQPGRMRAITLREGPQRAAHLDPDLPRAVLQWTGQAWKLVKVVPDLAAAKKVMHPERTGPEPW